MDDCGECGMREVKGSVTHRPTCSKNVRRRAAPPVGDPTVRSEALLPAYLRAYQASIGRKGGTARAARLTPEQRSEAARKAAKARWAAKR